MPNWYLYKNGALLAGPTHFMSAVAAMNRLSVIGYPGNNVFQKKRIYKVGSETYELSTNPPATGAPDIQSKVIEQKTPKAAETSQVKAVGVKFLDDMTLHRVAHKIYHYLTDIEFKAGDKCVILTPENSLKVATVQHVTDDPKTLVSLTKWVIDRIDMEAHHKRENSVQRKAQQALRAAEIRKALDEKLAATSELQKYQALGDAVSVQLIEELKSLSL